MDFLSDGYSRNYKKALNLMILTLRNGGQLLKLRNSAADVNLRQFGTNLNMSFHILTWLVAEHLLVI